MSQEQKLLQESLFKGQEEAIASTINSNTTIANQRLDQLSKKTKTNKKRLIDSETGNKK